jgi:hypothetical protein
MRLAILGKAHENRSKAKNKSKNALQLTLKSEIWILCALKVGFTRSKRAKVGVVRRFRTC